MFKPTQNIDTAFRAMRGMMVLVVAGSLAVSGYALYENALLASSLQDRVYVLSNGKAFEWDPLESTCRHASLSIL